MTSILASLEESINLNRLNEMHYEFVKNAFMANYMAALIFLRMQDLKGLRLINDPSHARVKSAWNNNMSDVNFWGKVLFNSKDKEVVKRMIPGHAKVLEREASKIVDSRIQAILKVPLTAPHLINWTMVNAMLLLIKFRFEITSSYCTRIISLLYKWDTATQNEKKKLVYLAFAYLQQSDFDSKATSRLRALNNELQLLKTDVPRKVIAVTRITEDGEGGGGAEASGTGAGAIGSTNAIIGGSSIRRRSSGSVNKEMGLGGLHRVGGKSPWASAKTIKNGKYIFRGGKPVKKRMKRWAPKKFNAPDYVKPQKEEK